MKIQNKRECNSKLNINHSVHINYKIVRKIYLECTRRTYSFLIIDTTSPADNPSHFRKNLLDSL